MLQMTSGTHLHHSLVANAPFKWYSVAEMVLYETTRAGIVSYERVPDCLTADIDRRAIGVDRVYPSGAHSVNSCTSNGGSKSYMFLLVLFVGPIS